MADDYTDDFMEDEEEGGSRRPFLLIAGVLAGLLILTILCALVFALSGRNGQQEMAEGIILTNEAIAAQNLLVTQTVAAMQTEAARPTDTPTPTNTPVPPTPTDTPSPIPTETPVVQPPDENGVEPVDDEEGDEETVIEATSIFPGAGVGTATPPPGTPGETAALPETGLELWAIVLAAMGLLFVLFIARRLRAAT